MKVIKAEHLGMCFGVRDAIALAMKEAQQQPLTILGDLVHNETVLAELRQRGIHFARATGEVTTPAVMITAHGASQKTISRARSLGGRVTEATCPLVHVAHRALKKLVDQGYHPVVVGKRDHVEVRGLTEDLADFDVVLEEQDILELREHPRFGIVAQTTQPVARAARLVELVRQRFPASEVRFVDTVCQPTKQRQTAAVQLAQQSDVVIVIGGANSNNTRELVNTCASFCSRVHHVRTADELRPEWIRADDTVGITAGTSTPDTVIHEIERKLKAWSELEPSAFMVAR